MNNVQNISFLKNYKNNIFVCIVKHLSFLLGMFSTMPILTLKINGILFSIFSILYMIILIILPFIMNNMCLKMKTLSAKLLLWFWATLISSLYGLLFYVGYNDWFNGIMAYMPKILSFIFILIFLFNSKYKSEIIEYFFKGLWVGCVANIIWGCVEGLFFYFMGYSLNNILFKDFIKTLPENRKYISIVYEGGIRVPGFNYDPAHLGTLVPIVFIYSMVKKNYIIMLMALLALVFSQSTTAMICIIIMFFINIKKILYNKKTLNYMLFYKTSIIIIIGLLLLNYVDSNMFVKSIKQNYHGFFDRVATVYINKSDIDPRTFYHLYLPSAIVYNGFNTLIGTGFNTASYPYVNNKYLMDKKIILRNYPYDPESVYISYLFDTGILGLLLYIYILLKIYCYFNRNWKQGYNFLIYVVFSGIIFSGFFYHYTLPAFHVLSIIMAAVLVDTKTSKVR